jgi:sugar phosphate permease
MFLLYSVTWLDTVYCTYYPTDDMEACEQSHITQGNTATASLLFTFFGMFSVLLCGQLKDSIEKKNRGYLLLANAVILFLVTSIMKTWDTSLPFPLAVFLVGMIGFGNFGPYKTMSGAFAVDFGGKSRKGDVTAWMGVASNGCAAIIILVKGFLSGWSEMFVILVVLSIGCIACSVLILMYDAKKAEEASVSAKPLLA